MTGDRFDRDEAVTTTTCLSCGGRWKHETNKGSVHSETYCRHCTEGRMTAAQVVTWKARTSHP